MQLLHDGYRLACDVADRLCAYATQFLKTNEKLQMERFWQSEYIHPFYDYIPSYQRNS